MAPRCRNRGKGVTTGGVTKEMLSNEGDVFQRTDSGRSGLQRRRSSIAHTLTPSKKSSIGVLSSRLFEKPFDEHVEGLSRYRDKTCALEAAAH